MSDVNRGMDAGPVGLLMGTGEEVIPHPEISPMSFAYKGTPEKIHRSGGSQIIAINFQQIYVYNEYSVDPNFLRGWATAKLYPGLPY